MGKRKVGILVVTLAGLLLLGTLAIADEPVKIIIDGKAVTGDTAPQIVNNRLLVPLRLISENMGAQVKWDDNTRTVSIIPQNQKTAVPPATTAQPVVETNKLLKLNGEQTTWPYWYEDGKLYLEWRDAQALLREIYPPPLHTVNLFPKSGGLGIDSRRMDITFTAKGNYKIVSLNDMQREGFIKYQFEEAQGNLAIIK